MNGSEAGCIGLMSIVLVLVGPLFACTARYVCRNSWRINIGTVLPVRTICIFVDVYVWFPCGAKWVFVQLSVEGEVSLIVW